ncbi:hypothetical protein LPUS_01932 [Lasallia pustulata]|uniref:DUF3074 domain-containing protein n=1 Tax=Lasallia pustulata TaxID=136370 RepID=A0A1W5CRL8_9LECA|nr:hypothetical protein LPUS_01932 [Lasallia pustulata]
MATRASLGNLIRIAPLQLSELPNHPALARLEAGSSNGIRTNAGFSASNLSPQAPKSVSTGNENERQRPALLVFIKAVLDEAAIFVDDIMPNTFKESGEKASIPAAAKVKLLKRDIGGPELSRVPWATSTISRNPPKAVGKSREAWFARRSRHANRSDQGTADFPEFDDGLRVNHSEHERDYTPDVYDAYRVLDWDSETVKHDFAISSYSEIHMSSERTPFSPVIDRAPANNLIAEIRSL